jgi:hypothetical protein
MPVDFFVIGLFLAVVAMVIAAEVIAKHKN